MKALSPRKIENGKTDRKIVAEIMGTPCSHGLSMPKMARQGGCAPPPPSTPRQVNDTVDFQRNLNSSGRK